MVNVAGTAQLIELCFNLNTGSLVLHPSKFYTFQVNHQSLQWNVCAYVNNFYSNLVEFVDFSNLGGRYRMWAGL